MFMLLLSSSTGYFHESPLTDTFFRRKHRDDLEMTMRDPLVRELEFDVQTMDSDSMPHQRWFLLVGIC
jgi:hypothetical protein